MSYEEERKKEISYCGVYCLKCDWLAGNIKEPTDKLLAILKARPEVRMWCTGEKDEYDYKNFVGVLEYLSKTGFCRFTCKEGSGYDGCPVRKCCEEKELSFCFECGEFPCKKWGKWPFDQEKIQDLCKIREIGVEAWTEKQWREYDMQEKRK